MLGITGTGGSGKSSLTDELVRRFRLDQEDKLRIAVLAVDPTRRKGGGALLGDRIRMNSLTGENVFFRSMATRGAEGGLPERLADVIAVLKAAGFDLVIVETPGIGQGDAAIVPFVDRSLYVMTPEFGAASQLEKIDMLDFADAVAINKFERRGAEDARRDVGRQLVRNREEFGATWEDMPVFGTSAATFNDEGVTALYQHLRGLLLGEGRHGAAAAHRAQDLGAARRRDPARQGALPRRRGRDRARLPRRHRDGRRGRAGPPAPAHRARARRRRRSTRRSPTAEKALPAADAELLDGWAQTVKDYAGDELVVRVRDKELHTALTRETLSGSRIPRVALPRYTEDAELLRFLRSENLPGRFPFTAGVFDFKREGEDPARMFAGEGDAFRTNRRFKILSADSDAKRLSTAFDSVTLYGRDPDTRPDVYGKVGTSGVSIATLDDMKVLYGGFDLCSPTTSVSMTINGPAPTILAYYLNTAIDQRIDAFRDEEGREPDDAEREELAAYALANVRGTVQADILKEDQGQNTCIFSTEFSLRMMADIQEWFIAHKVRNFYSVSISGYHIAEAGANPISQLAFTLANGFTYVESYLARGMDIDDFAPNLSFFFSNGMDAEYSVIGRVARRIWAVAMRERYGANERSQKLKYHVQTSGRSLHAQEMDFNDIRTTLQALCAIYDNANSLHTNAYDEAVTTPTEESVRRAHGHPADHQPRVGPRDEREPAAGLVHHRGAHRPRRGGGARRVRPDRRARRRARRDGDRLPARPDPGRVDALRAPQARRLAADHRRQHVRSGPSPTPRRRRSSSPGRPRPRSRASSTGSPTSTPATPRDAPGRAAPAAGRRHRRRQRVRRADGGRAGVLARPDHRRALRGRRPVPPQHVAAR